MEIVAARTEFELRRAPARLANWRLSTLDWLLRELEELRLTGFGSVPDGMRARITMYAEGYDPVLARELAEADPNDLARLHDALFDAQGRVMIERSDLRGTPSWRETEELFSPSAS